MSDTPDHVHNHPTVQYLLKSHKAHRITILVLGVLLMLAGAALVYHQIQMAHDEDALGHTFQMEH